MSAGAIVGLMATRPSMALATTRSLPSVQQQSKSLDTMVIVFDQRQPSSVEIRKLQKVLGKTPLVILKNQGPKGASASWNTGLNWINKHYPDSYVAMLDDDDCWDADHIETCWETAANHGWTDIIVSGLRRVIEETVLSDPMPAQLTVNHFLCGNPGWQGSNTFVKATTLMRVDGFTPGLPSCNDRDLAIRLLSLPNLTQAQTHKFTATWYCNERTEALSAPGSETKLEGLAQFLMLHQHLMNPAQRIEFFDRAHKLFHFTQEQIIRRMSATQVTRNVTDGLSQSSPSTNQRDSLP